MVLWRELGVQNRRILISVRSSRLTCYETWEDVIPDFSGSSCKSHGWCLVAPRQPTSESLISSFQEWQHFLPPCCPSVGSSFLSWTGAQPPPYLLAPGLSAATRLSKISGGNLGQRLPAQTLSGFLFPFLGSSLSISAWHANSSRLQLLSAPYLLPLHPLLCFLRLCRGMCWL